MKTLSMLLPPRIDNQVHGNKIPYYVFALITLISTVRGFIHLLAPDGGAGSIAGMDSSAAGAIGIIFAFALWGSVHRVYAIILAISIWGTRDSAADDKAEG